MVAAPSRIIRPVSPTAKTDNLDCRKLAALERKMVEHTASVHNKKLAAVRSVPGVGRIVVCAYLAERFRPGRFQRGEEVAAYLGLAPLARHSGDKTPAARIRPTGQTRLRSLLVEAAWIWKARDPGIQAFYHRMLRNTGVVQKAITPVARKLSWGMSEKPEYAATPPANEE